MVNYLKNRNRSFAVPKELILSAKKPLYITPYIALLLNSGVCTTNTVAYYQFADMLGQVNDRHIKTSLLPVLQQYEELGYIKLLETKKHIMYSAGEKFGQAKQFGIVYLDEIQKIANGGQNNISRLLYLLSYIRIRMRGGLYYQSYSNIADTLGLDKKTVGSLCDTLNSLGIIAVFKYKKTYGKGGKHTTVRFEVFSDMHLPDWESKAQSYIEQLKQKPFANGG